MSTAQFELNEKPAVPKTQEAGAPELERIRESRDPSEAPCDVVGLGVGQHSGRGPTECDSSQRPDAPKLSCGIILKRKVMPRSGADDLNEKVTYSDTSEVSIGISGVAWFGRFGR